MSNRFNNYLKQLNYSTCNVDSFTEVKALKISKNDVVLCLTGSGGPVLNLLIQSPQKIIAIDFNPIQNWLLELKIAAIKNLNYIEFTKLLGLVECKNRLELFEKIKNDLSNESLNCWEKHSSVVKRGILYQGELERNFKIGSNVLKLSMEDKVDRMFSLSCLKDQVVFYEKEWKTDIRWKTFLKNASSFYFINNDAEPAYVDLGEDYDFVEYCSRILDKGFKTHLIKENHFLSLMIDGSYDRVSKLPLWLQEQNFNQLKENLYKIEIVTNDINTYLAETSNNTIDKFAVSNVMDYLSEEESQKLYKNIINTSRNNGRFCARYIIKRPVPTVYSKYIQRDIILENQLEKQDLALEYKFVIGSITK